MRTRAIVAAMAVTAAVLAGAVAARAQERPNILWLSSEDNGRRWGPTVTSTPIRRISTGWPSAARSI